MISEADMRNILRHRCKEAGSQRNWCRETGVKESTASAMLAGRLGITKKVALALGYNRNVNFTACTVNDDVQ